MVRRVLMETTMELTQSICLPKFELPSLLHIGASYDFWFGPKYHCNKNYNTGLRLLETSHQILLVIFAGGGVEYGFRDVYVFA